MKKESVKLKFVGSKLQPAYDHCVVLIDGKYIKMRMGQVVEVQEEESFRLRGTGQFALEVEADKPAPVRPSVVKAPPSENRAILEKGE